jgi:uncharacterized protein YecE (DUF72 family)
VRAWRDGRNPSADALVSAAAKPAPRDVYVYFDNDIKVRAPYDAQSLIARVSRAPSRKR